ncbi:MAG: molybdopterin cofactor-binding domain-containing protein, partial [Elusimicrobiota bacterium]|nr:molybdopterin cofactor-binding domain-containing protein [Elusimicrobiota bacterium]
MMKIKFKLNGKVTETDVPAEKKALYILKDLHINSVRKGCDEEGKCGNCSILLDGKLVNSCLLIAPQINGKNITTVEALSKDGKLHKIQQAFIDAGLVQCGYCTPAQILAVKALLDKIKKPSKEQINDALSGVLCRCTGYKQIYNAIDVLTKGKKPKDFTPEYKKDYRVVGKITPKIDAIQMVKAEDSYVEDYVAPDALHLYVLGSPHPHAEIVSIDTSAAEKMEGVEYILTHKNSPKTWYTQAGQSYPEPSPYDQQVINSKMRFIGDRVAAVAATSLELAEKAASKIKVKYKILKPVFTIEEASAKGAPVIHDRDSKKIDPLDVGANPKRNLVCKNSGGIGDMKKGFAHASVIAEESCSTPPIQHTPMEPHTAYAYMKNDRLIIHTSVQTPFHVRRIVASILGLAENKVRVIKEKVGGGFGAKQDCGVEDLVGTIAYQSGKHIYYRISRKDEFIIRTRPAMFMTVKAGADKNGKITALSIKTKADAGGYGPHALTVPMNGCSKTLPLFKCENMFYEVQSYYTNNIVSGAYQGYGVPQTNFAVHVVLAQLAQKLGMKFEDFVSKNIVSTGYRLDILKQLGEGREGLAQKLSSCGLQECIKQGLKKYNKWSNKKSSPGDEIVQGKGMAVMMQGSGIPGLDAANAMVKMISDGTFMLYIGGADLGTGEDTVAAKVVAEELGVNQEQIAVTAADTDTTPFDKGSYASSGTFFTGNAAYTAAKNMKELIIKTAAGILKLKPSQVKIMPIGKVGTKTKNMTFRELALATQAGDGAGQLITSGAFTTQVSPIPYAAHFCQVSVNKRTGMLKVDRYYALHDCGVPINPDLAKGQVYGGVLKTIGHTFYEGMEFDKKGKCLTD